MVIATCNLESFFRSKQTEDHGLTPQAYSELYGLDSIPAQHSFHTITIKDFKVSVQVFTPAKPRGQFFLMHGFTDHVGNQKKIIQYRVHQGFEVIAHDHPGHGLTTGQRGAIDSFLTYAEVADTVIQSFSDKKQEQFLVAHSMGGAVALEMLYQNPKYAFKTVFLLAPLVRICRFNKNRILFRLMGRLKPSVARSFSVNSNDPAFMRFVHGVDPLQLKQIPASWLNSYFNWFSLIGTRKPLNHRFAIITGTADATVDSLYTTSFFGNWPNVSLLSLAGARHHLPGEVELYQQRMQDFMRIYFK